MRWLLDQGLPRSTVALLNNAAQDAIHVGDIGMASAADVDILAEAVRQKRTVVTLDADFHALLAGSAAEKPSVLRIREEGLKGPTIAAIILQIAKKFPEEIDKGCVFSYSGRKLRFRKLPLAE